MSMFDGYLQNKAYIKRETKENRNVWVVCPTHETLMNPTVHITSNGST